MDLNFTIFLIQLPTTIVTAFMAANLAASMYQSTGRFFVWLIPIGTVVFITVLFGQLFRTS